MQVVHKSELTHTLGVRGAVKSSEVLSVFSWVLLAWSNNTMTLSGIPPKDKISQVTQMWPNLSMTSRKKETGGLFDEMFVTDEVKIDTTHICSLF